MIRSMRLLPLALLTALVLATITNSGCRTNRPEQAPSDTTAANAPAPDSGPQMPPDLASDTITHTDSAPPSVPPAAPGPAGNGPAWKRAELVEGVQEFVTAIDSNNESRFWGSLSRRSLTWIDEGKLASRAEIWKAARQTLADIENRRITVIGGSRDSVALKIEGMRLVDGARENDPVIIHLLREQGQWRVMYPGLLYPMHHLQR
jgi:hypothetical protein